MSALYHDGEKVSGTIGDANGVKYNNENSGLEAQNVQQALDEITSNFQVGVNKIITSINTKLGYKEGDENYLSGNSTPDEIVTQLNQNLGGNRLTFTFNHVCSDQTSPIISNMDISKYKTIKWNCTSLGSNAIYSISANTGQICNQNTRSGSADITNATTLNITSYWNRSGADYSTYIVTITITLE